MIMLSLHYVTIILQYVTSEIQFGLNLAFHKHVYCNIKRLFHII